MKKRFLLMVALLSLGSILNLGTVYTQEDDKPRQQKIDTSGLDEKVIKGLDLITPKLLKEYLSYLASDELEGRGSGQPGAIKATEFIAKCYKEAGLKPVGKNEDSSGEGYFQHFKHRPKLKPRNTLGFIEGSDEKLKDEIIVIGAHHDHAGSKSKPGGGQTGRTTDDDKIWNGADDNGSGTTTILSLVKAFGESGYKPKRSILFMTFDAEELGLLGSAHYSKNPVFDIEKHVAMINCDMLGRNGKKAVNNWGTSTFEGSSVKEIVEKAMERTKLKVDIHEDLGEYWMRSDQANFYKQGIPAMFFFTGLHADYHKITDHSEKIEYDRMALIGKTVFLIICEMANMESVPKCVKKKPRRGK